MNERTSWHPVARSADLQAGVRVRTRLLSQALTVGRDACGAVIASPSMGVCERFGLIWLSLAAQPDEMPAFPEQGDTRYRTVLCGPFGVLSSAPRIIENFLDLAHFPYVHPGMLGVASHTEVRDYDVNESAGGLIATNCAFWQPGTDVLAHEGSLVHYEYRVPGPYTAVLAKLPEAKSSFGVAILLAVQPLDPERSIAWMVFCTTNHGPSDTQLRANQDRIFLQDKPILENQRPLCLPLDPRAEMPVRCDRLSVAYRRWLARSGVCFGVIPA